MTALCFSEKMYKQMIQTSLTHHTVSITLQVELTSSVTGSNYVNFCFGYPSHFANIFTWTCTYPDPEALERRQSRTGNF